jgi:outer membrane biosynthesis protein TonB
MIPKNMRRLQRMVLVVSLIAIAPNLAGCANFDPESLDVFGFGEKKKLAGDRKPLFPEGVPGVSQGIPPEYVKGNQPPPDNVEAAPLPVEPAKKTAAVAPADEPKPKPKRKKPRVVAAPRQAAPQQSPGADQQAPAAWPAEPAQPQPAQPQGQGSGTAPWPSSPAPGTFQR